MPLLAIWFTSKVSLASNRRVRPGYPIMGFGIPVRCLCWAHTSLSQLADGMAYYSCHDFSWGGLTIRLMLCGPRGIRTLDLLNAIETRSQLRYGPGYSDQFLSLQ